MGPGQGQQLEGEKGRACFSVAVVTWLEGAITGHAQVLGLLLSQLPGRLSYCFVQLPGQEVDPSGVLVWTGSVSLHQHLPGEGVAHHVAG